MDVKEVDAVIHRVFAGVSGYTTSLTARAAMAEDASRHYTYGEFSTEALAAMLAMAAPQPGEVFYDLGSGSGAALMTAHLLHPFARSVGVELLEPLHDLAVSQRARFLAELGPAIGDRPIELRREDICATDLGDADVLLGHWVCFDDAVMPAIEAKLGELRPGARVLVASKWLGSDALELRATIAYPTKWGTEGSCRCYVRR